MIIKRSTEIVKIYGAKSALQLCKVELSITASRIACDGWWSDLDHPGCPIGLRVHHRDMICTSTRDVGVSIAAADPLVIDSLVRVERAVSWHRVFITGHHLG